MNKKALSKIGIVSLLSFSLVSCSLDNFFSRRTGSTDKTGVPSSSSNPNSDKSNKDSTDSSKPSSTGETVTVFSVNDLHGKIKNDTSYNGMVALQGAIKGNPLYDPDTSAILSAGDMWQGSYISGYDKGASMTDLMNEFNFQAMTLGNHEFDWGYSKIFENEELANFPFICANLIDTTTKSRPEQIKDHVVLDLGGYKLGVVGAIGATLESSIKASALGNYEFSDSLSLLSTALQSCKSEGAQSTILLLHADMDDAYTNSIQKSGYDFLGIFGGHSHSLQLEKPTSTNNIIPYVQGACDSKAYSYMTIDTSNNELVNINYVSIDSSMSAYADTTFETKVNALINERQTLPLGQIVGNWGSDKTMTANFVLRAMFYAAQVQYPDKNYTTDNLVAVHNQAGIRSKFPNYSKATSITMETIQTISPFDNSVMLVSNRSVSSANVGNYYTYPSSSSLSKTKTMDVVTIDYLTEKYPNASGSPFYAKAATALQKDNSDYIIYDCIADYVVYLCVDGDVINASDYA